MAVLREAFVAQGRAVSKQLRVANRAEVIGRDIESESVSGALLQHTAPTPTYASPPVYAASLLSDASSCPRDRDAAGATLAGVGLSCVFAMWQLTVECLVWRVCVCPSVCGVCAMLAGGGGALCLQQPPGNMCGPSA